MKICYHCVYSEWDKEKVAQYCTRHDKYVLLTGRCCDDYIDERCRCCR